MTATPSSTQSLRIGFFLGMPDNTSTRIMLFELAREGVEPDFVVLHRPTWQQQFKRFKRKLASDGIWAALQRAIFALLGSKKASASPELPGLKTPPDIPAEVAEMALAYVGGAHGGGSLPPGQSIPEAAAARRSVLCDSSYRGARWWRSEL